MADLLDLPYFDRQLIAVTDDFTAEKVVRDGGSQNADRKPLRANISSALSLVAWSLVKPPILVLADEVIKKWSEAKNKGLKVNIIGKTRAKKFSFPPGHPRDGVLYIGHPALPNVYYVTADFHRVVFEHKFCEAVELLMSLGAAEIRVECVSGWSKDFSSRLTVPLGQAIGDAEAAVSEESRNSKKILYKASLPGVRNPSLPEGLVWYPHEPTWQTIANGRLKYGLNQFSLSVSYEDDFGINALVKGKIQNAGFELGGKFEDHQATVWRLEGRFGHPGSE